ncbi:hypothetical protein MP638_001908 [Amoeboaphelidium occidentale]|nr:hypothetical protein MP638_001908 [Amoeboaphelidium occidentale]
MSGKNSSKVAPAPHKVRGWWFLDDWFFGYVYRIGFNAWLYDRDALKFVLAKEDSAPFNAQLILDNWNKEKQEHPKDPSVFRALWKSYGKYYALVGLYKLVWSICTWFTAWYGLKMLLEFVQYKQSQSVGQAWALALFLGSFFSSIAIHQLYSQCNRVAVRVRAAVSSLVYRKALRLSRVRGGAGEVINILTGDLQRLVDAVANGHFLWSAFIESAAIIIISFLEIGISAIPALGFVILLLPLQMYLASKTSNANREQTATTTERVHIMSEILTAIKLIKFYAWEKPFRAKIDKIREKEIDCIYTAMMIKTLNFAIVFSVPVLIAVCSLAMYVSLGNTLQASTVFAVLSVFNTLRYPLLLLPMSVKGFASGRIALKKLDRFLDSEEIEELQIAPAIAGNEDLACEIKDADFRWDGGDTDAPTIKDINLTIKKGQKVAVIGDVGAGKSSLLCALLGQIRQTKGDKLKVFASTSYVSQEAWLFNDTLRQNILFGKDYDKEKYLEVVRVSGLQRDLTLLLAGDQTEIAERGANLSGGQRQRTSIARAVYYDADIILMDDALSAVDQHVGSHIFNECIMGYLKDKTVIMAIHQLQYLSQMDWIVMMKDGVIERQGTFEELMKYDKFSDLISRHVDSGEIEEADDEPEVSNDKNFELPAPPPQMVIKVDGEQSNEDKALAAEQQNIMTISSANMMYNELSMRKLHTVDERSVRTMLERNSLASFSRAGGRRVDIKTAIEQNEYSVYSIKDVQPVEKNDDDMQKAKGKITVEDKSADFTLGHCISVYAKAYNGAIIFTLACLFFFLVHGIRIGSDYWLRLWVPRVGGFSDAVYLGVYAGAVFLFATGVFLRGWWMSYLNVKKSSFLHSQLFHSVMRAPMSLFDSTPVGRILAAFSKHMLHVDDIMPDALFQFLQYAPLGLGALILCAVIVPYNYIPVLVLVAIASAVVYFSGKAEDKTKALEAITRPPIYAHLTCTLEGLLSIRSYHAEARFDQMNLAALDDNHSNLMAMNMVKSWIALNLDILSSLFVYGTALLIVVNPSIPDRGSVAGLALSNALQMLVFVQWTVRMFGDVISQMSSVGQIDYYGTKITPEAPANIPETHPGKDWPQTGTINFENVVLRYTPNGVNVLKNVSWKVYPGEKIGIVGATGSGKSTLLVALLRIVESYAGKITIDGVDISKIGLEELRSCIAIIPQEPVLFKGTVRSNLDPFNKATDDEIWKALEAVYLKDNIAVRPGKLDSEVIENGKNFSLGQRQLFCIARAILSKSKVLVLDEATANVSPETDMLIQKAIRDNFNDLTVLTIAHRLNTVIDSTRVLVMDAGQLVEFDEPLNLLKKDKGNFKHLVSCTGPATAKRLYDMAEEAYESNSYLRHYYEQDQALAPKGNLDIQQFASGNQK